MALAQPSDLGAYLHISVGEEDVSALLALDAASGVVESYIGQSVVKADEDRTVRINGTGDSILLVPAQPCSVSEVVILEDDEEVTLDPEADYYLDSEAGILYALGDVFPKGKGNIQITYNSGYDEVPAAIQIVAIQLAARIYDQGLAASESMNGYSISYLTDAGVGLTDYERRILDVYRLKVKTL